MTEKKENTFLLYGANGYTGALILEEAVARGLRPILAGRSEERIKPLAEKYNLDYRIFSLEDEEAVEKNIRDVKLVLHAAGPFIHTARPMMEACLLAKTHYIDITGEIAVFEMARRLDGEARTRNITIMPGVGFDVVPTDCLAVFLKQQLPGANHLKLAFESPGGVMSHGTALTMVETLGEGGAERREGKIVRVPLGKHATHVNFAGKPRFVMSIPWGDVSTAYHSTGIPNIITYVSVPSSVHQIANLQRYAGPFLRSDLIKNLAKTWVDRNISGPSPEHWPEERSYIWGQVDCDTGGRVQGRLEVLGGYQLTVLSSLKIAEKILGDDLLIGYQTPAGAYGPDLIMELSHTRRELLND